jgi:hypothetical protein
MNQEQQSQVKFFQEQAKRIQEKQDREALVEKIAKSIQQDDLPEDYKDLVRQSALPLLRVAEQIILNAQRGRCTRHQYADGLGSLAGVDISIDDIDNAIAVIRKIRGI